MVDDGRASCPFVSTSGCTIYKDRPGACRTYPVGRASRLTRDGARDFHVLINEPHCRGFQEASTFTVSKWFADQELDSYNAMNDEVMRILHHPLLKKGVRIEGDAAEKFLLAFYRVDEFRAIFISTVLPPAFAGLRQRVLDTSDDKEILKIAVQWLQHELFHETSTDA
jgi:hypothetical protein